MTELGVAADLTGRVAVVTGAGHGLGRSHALVLAAAGARVLANDVDGDAVAATVDAARDAERGAGEVEADTRSLGSVASGRELVAAAVERFGRVDVVVNNAGVSSPTDVAELDDAALDRHLAVHLHATVGATGEAFARMAGRGYGRVVNTVSGHGLVPRAAGSSAYAAAKAAVFGFTRAAALEVPDGVTVNAVAPLALTRMSEEFLARVEGAEERFAPDHVSRVVLALCADEAAAVNGRVLRVEGERVGEYELSGPEMHPVGRLGELLGLGGSAAPPTSGEAAGRG